MLQRKSLMFRSTTVYTLLVLIAIVFIYHIYFIQKEKYCLTFASSVLNQQKANLKKHKKEVEQIVEILLTELVDLKLSLYEKSYVVDKKYEKLQNILQEIKSEGLLVNKSIDNSGLLLPSIPKYSPVVSSPLTQDLGLVYKPNRISLTHLKRNILNYSCKEYFVNTTYGYPLYTIGFRTVNCQRLPFNKTVTLILDRPNFIDIGVNLHAKFQQIFIILDEHQTCSKTLPKGNCYKINAFKDANTALGAILNRIITKVTTEFVLLAPFLASHDQSFSLGRLINVMEESDAVIVGSAARDAMTTKWNRGCHQSNLKFYVLRYINGYFDSERECLRCNHTENPFLARASFLRKNVFHENLTFGIYHDYFLRLQRNRILVCPDVMFHVVARQETPSQLSLFAELWDIKKMVKSNKEVIWFGCRRGFNHTTTKKCKTRSGMAVPPCCLANLLDAISNVFKLCFENNITCILQEGSVLGIVKFHSVLPWERDADFAISSRDIKKFNNLAPQFKLAGYDLVQDEETKCCTSKGEIYGGVLHLRANGWSLQIYGYIGKLSSSYTTVLVNNYPFIIPENPGNYSRNRYGKNIYKHVEHWMAVGLKNGWNSYNTTGFSVCSNPGHHACLDQNVNDGDILFQPLG